MNEAHENQFSGEYAIRIDAIFKKFRQNEEVLKGVSIGFPKGKLTYILGSSGAGKSVILKHLLGLLKPDRGKIWIENEEMTSMDVQRLTKLRLKFGMLFQNSALFDDLTVYENVAFPLYEHTTLSEKEVSESVFKTLERLGMKQGLDKYPNELSGGMRKRVALARAIIREPSILLYDEPTTGLDPVTRKTVDELIETLKRDLKLTSIVISHDIPSALLLADFIAFLDGGKIVFFGTPLEFRKSTHPSICDFINAERHAYQAFSGEL